jgi:hypothetical protein
MCAMFKSKSVVDGSPCRLVANEWQVVTSGKMDWNLKWTMVMDHGFRPSNFPPSPVASTTTPIPLAVHHCLYYRRSNP